MNLAQTVTGFVERALTFFAGHGITAKRLQTDNAWSYIHNRSLRELLVVVEWLMERSIALVSLEEKIDPSSAAGELVFHVFGAIAQRMRGCARASMDDATAEAKARGRKRALSPDKRRLGWTC